MTEASNTPRRSGSVVAAIIAYIAVLTAAAAAVALVLTKTGEGSPGPPGRSAIAALPFLAGLLVAAEYLFVRYRYRGETNALNLVEAALAPLLFAFAGPTAMLTVAISQAAAETMRRNAPLKAAFNIAQWTLAAGVGALTLTAVTDDAGITGGTIFAVVVSQLAIAVINHVAFTIVLALSNRQSPRRMMKAVMIPGWAVPWTLNSLMGVLFVLAYHAHPAAVVLFPIPLVVLHLAYRGYAGARSDRVRLAGLHEAAQVLATPLDPRQAIEPFLREVARCFEARAAALVFRHDEGLTIHRYDTVDGFAQTEEAAGVPSLEAALIAHPQPTRITASGRESLSRILARAGCRDCLSAPLMADGLITGALLVYDQAGLEGFETGEIAVIEALARETAGTLAKGRLLETILEERRKLSEIVCSSSDGICTIDTAGIVTSWNPAMERITGIKAQTIVERPGGLSLFQVRTPADNPVDLASWTGRESLPEDLRSPGPGRRLRHLSCSYSKATEEGTSTTLVMTVRDVTPQIEMRELRERVGRLAEAEAAQRSTVEQLQQAVMPVRPEIAGVELGVAYVSSDPTSPTGGDLYDWHQLPTGELHIAVVDVLGHGVAATQDALAVVHALRLLALQLCPLDEIVERADALLASQHGDLVATVVVGRYDAATGTLRMAGGGHPPPLLVTAGGGVTQIALPGGAIGWPNAGSKTATEITLAAGDGIVLYTDGLVEAGKNIIEGTDALARHAGDLKHLSAETLAAQLVHRSLADGDRRDDSLALVLRHSPAPVIPERAGWRIPPDPRRVPEIRREFAAWLEGRQIDIDAAKDVEIIAGELLANAVGAGRSTVSMRIWIDLGTLFVEVEDDGIGREDLGRLGFEQPSHGAEAGRGLFIVRALSDEMTVLSTGDGTTVRCAKALGAQARLIAPAIPRSKARR